MKKILNSLIMDRFGLKTFQDLKEALARMEPELATLLQTAEQLFTNATAIEKEGTFRPSLEEGDIFITPEFSVVLERISDLNHRLKTLQKVCDAYVKHLSLRLQRREDGEPGDDEAALLSLSDQVRYKRCSSFTINFQLY